jgi:hypothetical protein
VLERIVQRSDVMCDSSAAPLLAVSFFLLLADKLSHFSFSSSDTSIPCISLPALLALSG